MEAKHKPKFSSRGSFKGLPSKWDKICKKQMRIPNGSGLPWACGLDSYVTRTHVGRSWVSTGRAKQGSTRLVYEQLVFARLICDQMIDGKKKGVCRQWQWSHFQTILVVGQRLDFQTILIVGHQSIFYMESILTNTPSQLHPFPHHNFHYKFLIQV